MTELERIKEDLQRVKDRLHREINYQAGHKRSNLCCNPACMSLRDTYNILNAQVDPDLHRLQQNLAEIRKEIGCLGATQERTMVRLREVLNSAGKRWSVINKIREAVRGID